MAEVEDRRRQQLGFTPAEDLHERAVHAEEVAVDRRECHADRRVLERAAEPLLRFPQFRFCSTPIGEVARADHDALDRRVVEKVGGDGFDDTPTAVTVP